MQRSEELAELAQRTAFQEAALNKVLRLLELLADIRRHPLLSEVLVHKGDTALNLGFGAPRRLSVDLDFNYMGQLEREAMQQERPQVENALTNIARSQGYEPQWSSEAHAGRKCFLSFRTSQGAMNRVEVDINYLHRQPLLPVTTRAMWSPVDGREVGTAVLSVAELCAGKICAMLDRATPRDMFDVRRLPEVAGQEWRTAILRGIVMATCGTLPHALHSYGLDRMARLSDSEVQQQLHPMLIRGETPSAADLVGEAWSAIEPFLCLTDREREFSDRLQRGELLPELLFPDDEELGERVRRHPGLMWKAQNAAERVHGSR